MTQKVFAFVTVMLPMVAFASYTADQGWNELTNQFYQEASCDAVPDGEMAGLPLESGFCGFLGASGWTREQLFGMLRTMASNLCTQAGLSSNTIARASYLVAVQKIGQYGTEADLPTLDHVIRNGEVDYAGDALEAYLRIAGYSDRARTYYSGLTIGTNALTANKLNRVFGVFYWASPTNASASTATNFMNHFLLDIGTRNDALQTTYDQELCRRWPGYATSSNRLRQVGRVLAAPANSRSTIYFLPIQAQLNAATNLVELSTNDFLNAGE